MPETSGRSRPARVVVTGLGAVTPVGTGRAAVWEALCAGKSGVGPVRSFDTTRFAVHVGAEVHDFDPGPYLELHRPDQLGRASQLAVAATRLALRDADLDAAPAGSSALGSEEGEPRQAYAAERVAVVMGTTSGEPVEVERYNDLVLAGRQAEIGAGFVGRYPCHQIAVHVAREVGAAGPNVMIPTACAAGNYAIAQGFDLLRRDRADLVLAGGADAFSRITYSGFARLGAIAPERCQPFDRQRKGMIPGEGAAVLVLERLDDARRRGATIYAEVVGYGLSCDAHHMTAAHPEGLGAARAMARALAMAGRDLCELDYISAHGTGTPTNDRLEVLAVERLFAASGSDRRPPMSSIKSMLGHTMGAASAIEALACVLAIRDGVIPPTINLEEPEGELDFVPNVGRRHQVGLAMNNAYAFGGNNASVLFAGVPS